MSLARGLEREEGTILGNCWRGGFSYVDEICDKNSNRRVWVAENIGNGMEPLPRNGEKYCSCS